MASYAGGADETRRDQPSCLAQALPLVYEIRDGRPALIQLVDIQADGALNNEVGSQTARPTSSKGWRPRGSLIGLWLGVAALVIPTLIENVQQNWSLDQGAQTPIVLAIGLWLLFRRWPAMRTAGSPPRGVASWGLAIGLWLATTLIYGLGRAGGQYLVESYALYGFLLIGVYALVGVRGLWAGGFPLAYLVFGLPIPFFVSHALTTHLRLGITEAIVEFFQACGVTIVRDGLTLMVDQYQLSVADACSGMNSLFSLSAIGLVYVYLRRPGRPLYYTLMLAPIVAFAILGNFVRIAIVVLLTHVFGDAVAQSLLHETIGFVTFAVSLGEVIALDALTGRWRAPR
jgi:exosortase